MIDSRPHLQKASTVVKPRPRMLASDIAMPGALRSIGVGEFEEGATPDRAA
jgi:hypothetical protein